jgi:hypothetical protein
MAVEAARQRHRALLVVVVTGAVGRANRPRTTAAGDLNGTTGRESHAFVHLCHVFLSDLEVDWVQESGGQWDEELLEWCCVSNWGGWWVWRREVVANGTRNCWNGVQQSKILRWNTNIHCNFMYVSRSEQKPTFWVPRIFLS